MTLYGLVVSIHVLGAILGLGPAAAVGVLGSASAAAEGAGAAALAGTARRLLRLVTWGLLLMLVSGVVLVWMGDGNTARRPWLHLSVALFLVLGFLHGQAMKAARLAAAASETSVASGALRRLGRLGWAMSLLVAVITLLMELKPW